VTVESTIARVQYDTNGTTGPWTVPFYFLADADISVFYADAAGTETELALSTDYSVTGVGDPLGGTVTTVTAYAAGGTITVIRSVEPLQETDWTNTDPFPAQTLERALDRLTQLVQQVIEVQARSIVVAASDEVNVTVPAAAARADRLLAFDSTGGVTVSAPPTGTASAVLADLINTANAAFGDALLGVKRTATGAVATTQHEVNEKRVFDLALDFGAAADGTTDNTTALQNALTAAAGNVLLIRKGSSFFKLTGRVTAPADTHIILEGAELKWTATTATGSTLLGVASRPGIEVTGDRFTIEGYGILRGPSVATFVANEFALFMKGTNTGTRKIGFTIRGNVEFVDWGYSAWTAQWVDHIDASGFYVHDCGHAGWFAFSCTHGDVRGFRVKNITPGDGSSQAYGFALTHDTTNYSTDPNIATPRLVANPFCIDFKVHDAVIEDVPTWQGADAHGGYEVEFYNLTVYNCRHGISLSGSSGGALNYAGENNKVYGCHATTTKRDGSATSVSSTDRVGINISGGSTVQHNNVQCWGNSTDGYGDTVVSSQSINAKQVRSAQIRGNTIRNWKGQGIYTTAGDGVIEGNIFEGVASATNAACIFLDTTTGTWNILGNKHRPVSGTASAIGLRMNDAGNPRCLIAANDLDYATTPYSNFDGTQTRGNSDITPQITATGTPTSIDVSAAGRAPRVFVYLNVSGNSTVTDLTGATIGQVFELYAPTANITTFDRTNSALAGGANWASTIHDTLVLKCINTSGTKFVEQSRAANS
jgi:hypothetical protein